ncbi:MAG: hypothetical protein SGARI_003045, partial [Bacillariaceae sp.]
MAGEEDGEFDGDEQTISLLAKTSFDNEPVTSAKFLQALYAEAQKITLFDLKEEGEISNDLEVCQNELEALVRECRRSDEESSASMLTPRFRALREKYNRVGANLLHLIQFVDINTKGILRLLRKHDKRVTYHAQQDLYELFLFGHNRNASRKCPYASATMMASLQNHQSLDALCVTLQDSYTELRLLQQEQLRQIQDTESTTRSTDTTERGRETETKLISHASIAKQPKKSRGRSPRGLGRRHRSIQGLAHLFRHQQEQRNGEDDEEEGGMDDTTRSTANVESFKPPTFALLKDRRMSYVLPKEDFIMAQIYAARRSIINQQNEVMNMLATTALGFNPTPGDNEDSIRAEYERAAALDAYKRSHAISSILNFVSSFIYMANYLIVVPTVVTYSQKLGANPALSSAIVGMTPFATIFSTIVYSWWTSYSYRIPLLVASSLNV